MSRSRVLLLVLALVGAVSAALAPTASAQDGFVVGGLYKTSYSSTIYVLDQSDRGPVRRAIGYEEWRDRGFAAPEVLASDTVKYRWAPTLFAQTSWPAALVVDRLDAAAWDAAGRPAPRDVGFLRISSIERYATGDELFLFPGCGDNVPGLRGQPPGLR